MSKSPILVGVSGIKGSGKSELCLTLNEHSVNLRSNIFSFAEPLKEFCIKVLGLTVEQCYGKDKETLTNYRWDSLPDYWDNVFYEDNEESFEYGYSNFMTARQVMQQWARIFRSMNEDIFVDRMKEKIESYKRYNLDVVFVDDLRHTNELKIFDVLVRIKGNTEKKDHGEFELENEKFHLYVEPKQAVESSKIVMSYVKDKYFGDNQ
jgi:hypothetical protein